MRNTLVYIATDPVAKRLMQEQRFAEMDVFSWKQTVNEQGNALKRKESTITQQGNTITQQGNTITQQGNIIAAQAQELEEYRRMYGSLTPSPN